MRRVPSLPQRIALILGGRFETLNAEHLALLRGAREDDDLEVKSQTYLNGDQAKREFCSDIAAFANGRGGLLVIGAEESGDVVVALRPLDLSGEELRLRGIAASGIAPPVSIFTRSVELADGGILLILVPASSDAPHAVIKDNDLRYPVRDGSRKRWMKEPEIANRYRGRFASSAATVARIDSVERGVRRRIRPQVGTAWLLMSAVPEQGGRLAIDLAGRRATEQWLREVIQRCPQFGSFNSLTAWITTGFRRYICGDSVLSEDDDRSRSAVCELHGDGSSASALLIGQQREANDPDRLQRPVPLFDTLLGMAVIDALCLAGAHADRAGSGGSISLATTLHSNDSVVLAHTRSFGIEEPIGRPIAADDFSRPDHTFAIDDLMSFDRLVSAAALVTSDLVSAFGQPECLQLTSDGTIRKQYVDHAFTRLLTWATSAGVPITEASIGS